MENKHINVKELWTAMMAFKATAPKIRGMRVRILVDNTTAVAQANRLTASMPLALEIVKEMWWTSITYDVQFEVVHIPGEKNVRADALSRGKMDLFEEELHKLDNLPHTANPGYSSLDEEGNIVLHES